jgi:hypothetical protein
VSAELELDTGRAQPILVLEVIGQIGERDRRSAAEEQFRRRDTTPRRADDGDALAANGE